MTGRTIAALDIGGTHVSAAMVDVQSWRLASPVTRASVRADASAERLLDTIAEAASIMSPSSFLYGVGIPDPFDYQKGVALYDGVGKFDSLHGTDIRAELARRLVQDAQFVFLNDADAFAIGEWKCGAAVGSARCVGITLGTGVGSGWIVDGRPVVSGPGVPPGGRIHNLTIHGQPLEDIFSRRAILRAYRRADGRRDVDVAEIARAARDGDNTATQVLSSALRGLGSAAGPAIKAFRPDVVVIGGSMARSWDLFEPWFREGAEAGPVPHLTIANDEPHAALIGAAHYASAISSRSRTAHHAW